MQWQKNLWVLSIGVLITNIAFTAVIPFFPAYLQELGLRENLPLWSGMVISATFLSAGLVSPLWGSLADRYGKRIMLARSGLGMAIVLVLIARASSPGHVLVYRIINGIMAGFTPAAIMLVVSTTPQEKMSYALGIINTFAAVGNIVGPFFGGTVVQYAGIRPALYASATILLVGTIMTYCGTRETVIKQTDKTTVLQDVGIVLSNRMLRLYFMPIIVMHLTTSMITPTLPLRIVELAAANSGLYTGIVFSVVGISMALGSVRICKITKYSNQGILVLSLLLCGAISIFKGMTASIFLLVFLRFLFGFAIAGVNVSGNVLITQNSGAEMRGRVFGVLNSFTSFGAVIGPLLGGFMGEKFGNASAFHGSAAFFFATAALIFYFQRGVDSSARDIVSPLR